VNMRISVAVWTSRFTDAAKVARRRATLFSAWRTSLSPRLVSVSIQPACPETRG
jgi:hypothetical protein